MINRWFTDTENNLFAHHTSIYNNTPCKNNFYCRTSPVYVNCVYMQYVHKHTNS